MLDRIRIASPCSASWDLMKGDDQVRFCSHCEKHVYNLSAMSRRDAEGLLKGAQGHVCTRFYRRADGTVLTEDCPIGLRERTARVRRRVEFAVSGLLGFAGLALAQTPQTSEPLAQVEQTVQAEITGVIKDPIGGVIPNAFVTLLDEKSGASVVARSNEKGEFRLLAPQPGSYTLKVEVAGFQVFRRQNLTAEKRARIDVTMQLGVLMGEVVEVKPTLLQKLRHLL
jgi:hypothetical protein